MINIALPKGRLGDKVYNLFSDIGYACPELLMENRKLVFVMDDYDYGEEDSEEWETEDEESDEPDADGGSTEAVSYTHLDVYKRQVLRRQTKANR